MTEPKHITIPLERLRALEQAEADLDAFVAEVERQKGVISAVNARCDHLGMRLGDVIKERDALTDDMLRYAMAAMGTGAPRDADKFRLFWRFAIEARDNKPGGQP